MNYKSKIGNFGQQLAGQFLRQRNYRILDENYRFKYGEIDLVAEKNGQLVFVEVKTRTSDKFGLPEEAVTEAKKAKMRKAIYKYLWEKEIRHDNFRLDIVAIEIDRLDKKAVIRHHKGV